MAGRKRRDPPFPPMEGGGPPSANQTHGAASERKQSELALIILRQYLADAAIPAFIKSGQFRASLVALCRVEAKLVSVWEYMDTVSIEESLTPSKAGTRPLVDFWRALEVTAMHLRSKLGLDPSSSARIMKDLGLNYAQAQAELDAQADAGAQIIEIRRRAIEGGV